MSCAAAVRIHRCRRDGDRCRAGHRCGRGPGAGGRGGRRRGGGPQGRGPGGPGGGGAGRQTVRAGCRRRPRSRRGSRVDRESTRLHRHARERRRHPAHRSGRRTHRRRLGGHLRRQHHRCLPHRPRRRTADGGPGARRHRHRRVQRRRGAASRDGRLRGVQGGGHHVHPLPGAGTRPVRRAVQRGVARVDRHRDAARAVGRGCRGVRTPGDRRRLGGLAGRHPARTDRRTADIAEAVVFLASDRARHITMHDLYVDGGATLRA